MGAIIQKFQNSTFFYQDIMTNHIFDYYYWTFLLPLNKLLFTGCYVYADCNITSVFLSI